jgi:hypothetical protein
MPAETEHEGLFSALTGPLKYVDASTPARKAHAQEIHEKFGRTSKTCELPWPVLFT